MPSEINITAISTNGWGREREAVETGLVRNAPSDHGLVLDYVGVHDLVQRVQALITIHGNPCLKSLEIVAHGDPISSNDLTRTDVNDWGVQLKTLPWCDEANIYLSSCNSGLARTTSFNDPNVNGPIAQLLANAMPFDVNNFAHKIIVHGSNGYISGTNATGDLATTASYSEGVACWRTDYPTYKGAQNATGSAVWNQFKNGNW